MLAEAGVSFFFVDEGDDTKLVLTDAPQAAPPREPALSFREDLMNAPGDHAGHLRIQQQVRQPRDYGDPLDERHAAQGAFDWTCGFETDALDVGPGSVIRVQGHARPDLERGLLIVETCLEGTATGPWVRRCEARSVDVPYRPPLRAPKPRILGAESATVVEALGEAAPSDEASRVRVRFHWGREHRLDDTRLCWVRVANPGADDLPAAGSEVFVEFLGGDPERPVITGRIPSQAKRDRVEADRATTVLNDDDLAVGNDRAQLVHGNARELVGASRTRVVGAHERVDIGLDQHISVGANHHVSVGADQDTKVAGAQSEDVGLVKRITVGRKVEIVCGKARIVLESSGRISLDGTEVSLASIGAVRLAGEQIAVVMSEDGVSTSGEIELSGGSILVNGKPIALS
jgi:type VI secretion system secreted protein VgrG